MVLPHRKTAQYAFAIASYREASLPTQRIIAAFVFPDAWSDLGRFRDLLGAFRDFGINAVMTESERYDAVAIDMVHALGLSFYAGVACFSDHATIFHELAERPELWPILETGERRSQMEWYIGLTPTDRRHQDEILARIAAIAAAYPIDGLFLDFVRWPLHWEIELRPGRPRPLDSSFDPATLAEFAAKSGMRVPPDLQTVAARAAWIRAHHLREWVDFKCKVVTDFVREARSCLTAVRPEAELGIYIVPDVDGLTEPLTGQRLADLAPLADWLSPMLYHNILLKPPSWIGAALAKVLPAAGAKTLPVLQADSNRDPAVAADWGPDMSVADWRAALAAIGSQPDAPGLIVFPGTSLIGNGRGEVLRAMVGARQ
jgi:hypothetical protein